jgi:molybdopterin-binding protein
MEKPMKLTTENILTGMVVEIKAGIIMTEVKVDIGGDEIITVMVTGEALKELDAKVGDELEFLIDAGVTATRTLH